MQNEKNIKFNQKLESIINNRDSLQELADWLANNKVITNLNFTFAPYNKSDQNWLSAEDKLKRLTGIKYVTSEMPIPDASMNGSKEEKTMVCLYDASLDFEEALTLAKKIYLSLNK